MKTSIFAIVAVATLPAATAFAETPDIISELPEGGASETPAETSAGEASEMPASGMNPAMAAEAPPVWADRSPIIVSGHRLLGEMERRKANQTPGGTDVVSREDYADRAAVSLRDVLSFSPGVYLQPRFGQEVRISVRGSGLSRGYHMRGLTLFQDGIPINLADGNGDLQELDPNFFHHLEIYRGANALRFGSATLGGAINGMTPTGRSEPGFHAQVDGGAFNTVRGYAAAGTSMGAGDVWIGVGADTSDGDRQHAKRHSFRFNGNAGLKLSDRVETRFYASFNHVRQELPQALTLTDTLERPKTGTFTGDQQRNFDSLRLQNRTTVSLGDAVLEAGVFLATKGLFHPIYQVVDEQSLDKGVYARLNYEKGIISATLGGESRWGTIDAKRFVNINGKRGALLLDATRKARTSSVYGELRVKPDPTLSLIAGGLYADGSRRQVQTVPAVVAGRMDYSTFSPRFGVLWEPVEQVAFYANYSRAAEFPTFTELAQVAAFVPITQQTAWTGEIGTRGILGPVSWDISLYRARLKGEMLQYTITTDIPASTFNADRTLHQGIELSLMVRPTSWLRLRQMWLYSDFRFRGDSEFGNNHLPVVPRHVLRTEMRIGNEDLHITPNVEWIPRGAWADYANTVRTPGYALLGLTAAAPVTSGLDLFVDVRNITGKRAVGDISAVVAATSASEIYYPVEHRAVYVGVHTQF